MAAPTADAAAALLSRTAQAITRTYTDRVPLSKYVAVMALVKRALKAGYEPQDIVDALSRLADHGRPVTADTLRIEMDGMTPYGTTGKRVSATDQALTDAYTAAAAMYGTNNVKEIQA